MALDHNQLDKHYVHEPARLVFGKSNVPCTPTGDVFEGIVPGAIPFVPQSPYHEPPVVTGLQWGGPFHFYKQFWATHNLSHLADLVPPELLAGAHTYITLPLLITNGTHSAQDGKLQIVTPHGWSLQSDASPFHVEGSQTAPLHVWLIAPATEDAQWRDIRITATLGTESLPPVNLRVQVAATSLPE